MLPSTRHRADVSAPARLHPKRLGKVKAKEDLMIRLT